MPNISRVVGSNISILMNKFNLSVEEIAKKLNYTLCDMYKILEGRVIIAPKELEKIANIFGKTKKDLIYYNYDTYIYKDKDKILDLIDDYIELKESI